MAKTFILVLKSPGGNAMQVSMPAAELIELFCKAPIVIWNWKLDVLPLVYNLPCKMEELTFSTPFLEKLEGAIKEHIVDAEDNAQILAMVPRLAHHDVQTWITVGIGLGYEFPPCVQIERCNGEFLVGATLDADFEKASQGVGILFAIMGAPNVHEGYLKYSNEEEN